ncbi:DUF4352 domain-containing protein [Streptomyces sp. SM12]|uniref:DUF4352 domain-containing protein n=1 Tax=Streptomyces sp. SM12 TaxID=1071602 RepID=UPI0011B09BEA|nr:DUF4352 domain-containing protein [Streptomyces sp. SM12]
MRATRVAAGVIGVVMVATGCGSSSSDEPSSAETRADVADVVEDVEPVVEDEPEEDELAVEPIGVGESAEWEIPEEDEYGDVVEGGTPAVMRVTLDAAEWVGASAEHGTSGSPDGEWLRLDLTVSNVGDAGDGTFSPYGLMYWESETHAAQDVGTLHMPAGADVDTTYRPGQSVSGGIVLDVPERDGVVSYVWNLFGGAVGFAVEVPE